jgi:hypothetical protein
VSLFLRGIRCCALGLASWCRALGAIGDLRQIGFNGRLLRTEPELAVFDQKPEQRNEENRESKYQSARLLADYASPALRRSDRRSGGGFEHCRCYLKSVRRT